MDQKGNRKAGLLMFFSEKAWRAQFSHLLLLDWKVRGTSRIADEPRFASVLRPRQLWVPCYLYYLSVAIVVAVDVVVVAVAVVVAAAVGVVVAAAAAVVVVGTLFVVEALVVNVVGVAAVHATDALQLIGLLK